MKQRLDTQLAKEDRHALEDDYWWEMQDAAASSGIDVVTLLEESPFEDWLRKQREAYGDNQGA